MENYDSKKMYGASGELGYLHTNKKNKNTKEKVDNLSSLEFIFWRKSFIFAAILSLFITYLYNLTMKDFFIILVINFSFIYFLLNNIWFHNIKPLIKDMNSIVKNSNC